MEESTTFRTPWALLGIHGLQTAASKLFGFAVPLFFVTAEADTASSAALATFNALTQVVKLVSLPFIGGLADRAPLVAVVPVAVAGQLTRAGACLLLWKVCEPAGVAPLSQLLVIVLLGSLADLANEFVSILLQMRVAPALASDPKAEAVAVDETISSARLAQINCSVRQVSLASSFLAPTVIGWLTAAMGGVGYKLVVAVAMIFVAGALGVGAAGNLLHVGRLVDVGVGKKADEVAFVTSSIGWSQLKTHLPIAGMSFAFTLLFCSVLTDSNPITTAYVTSRGVPVYLLGMAKSVSALTGLVGTFVWPRLRTRFGMLKGAGVALWMFVLTLAPVLPSLVWSPYPMLLCIGCSRVFLWAFDLSMVSVLQELVPCGFRGRAAGAQSLVCQLFELAISTLAVALPSAEQYPLIAAVSFCSVFFAGVVFTLAAVTLTRKQAATAEIELDTSISTNALVGK
eukprot:TRINITY_DN23902_c0_g1_i1.p1 TRINITY_DN23902_c0_g1~~TRINITY_DN23902_c0_g1_i1.p1  ORF type:complete len:469 (-),score=62.09 TRINITY_DN23902_c0_g1_i1:562-1932(-)